MITLFWILIPVLWANEPKPQPTDLIEVRKYDFSLLVDLEFRKKRAQIVPAEIDVDTCFLRREVAEALARAQQNLHVVGLGIKLLECYRPEGVQKILAARRPALSDEALSRGGAFLVTVVDAQRNPVKMPAQKVVGPGQDVCGASDRRKDDQIRCDRLGKELTREGFQRSQKQWWKFEFVRNSEYPIDNRSSKELGDTRNAKPSTGSH